MSSAVFSDIQYKASAGQVNLDQAQGIVECFVAGIGNKDSVGDVCATGAFTKSLMRRKPRVVWGHNWNDPIGKVLEIYEVAPSDPRLPGKMRAAGIGGLYAKVQFNLNSEKGREAFANVAFFGEEQEWSIGYKTLRAQFDQGSQANILYEVELYEVSPVLHGANQLTGTISVKSDEKGGMIPMMTSPMGMPDTYGQPKPGSEIERKLEEELSVRLGTPVKILKMEDGVVHFSRDGEQGEPSDYKCRYHMGDDGVFMFGRPERYESPVAKPVQRMPMGMPSKPMTTQNPLVPVVVPSAVPGASPSSPPMVRFNYQGTGAPTPGTNPKVVDEERDLAEALIRITKRYGKFNEDSTGVWAGYKSPAENPVAKIGVKCANCILYEGEGKCKIIAMAVEPEGKCRFAVIPDGVVTMGPIQKMNYDMEREEEEVKWLEEIEAKHPREFLDGSARIALRRNWVKREESKSLFRIDEYSEKSLNRAPDAGYVLPVSPEKAFEVKQLLDPIISYHMVDSYVEDGGIVFTNGVTKEFIEAVSEAASPVFFQQEKALGRSVSGKIRNSSRGLTARFNPKAWDGDNDGLVQEGTAFERPAVPGVNDYASRGRVDTRRATEAFEAQQQGQAGEKPVARGLSSGGDSSDGASKKLDDILNDMDDRWDTDSSREKFGEYLDTLDPDELEDARSNIAAQMRKDQASANNDGLLSEDVMNNDFDSLVESLKSEYDMDAVEAENEAGRMLEAADAYVARRENYLAADEDIARRLKGPKPKKSKEGLSSGAEVSDKEIFDFRMDGNSLDEAVEKFNMTREKIRAAEMRRASELRKSGSGLSSGSRRDNRKQKISKFRESNEYLGDVDEVVDRFEDRGVTGGIDSLLAKEDIEWPGFDAEEEELMAYREAREKMLEERGIRPLGEELRDGFVEDLGNGPSDSKQYIKDLPGYGNRLFLHRGNYEGMTTDFARNPDGKFGKDANLGDGWYMEKLVFDDYEGRYSNEPDFDTAGVVGPFNSEDEAIDWWMENGDNEDNPSGLSSGAGADDMPNYENSKKLFDLINQSKKPQRSDYDYAQDGGNTPTEEQKDIIDAVMEGADVVVGALAGSGKTSTLVSLAKRLKREKPRDKKTYVAFNKTAARDARRRFRDTGTAVRTLDSVTYGWYKSQGKEEAAHIKNRFSLNKGATGTPNIAKDITRKFKVNGLVIDGNNVDADDVSRIAKQAVDAFEISADETLLPSHFSLGGVKIDDVPQELMSLADGIWKSRTNTTDPDGMQFTNNTMTKLFALANPSFSNGEAIPGQEINMMMFDESQDLNPVWSGIIKKQDVQKIIVGDPNQAIYGFRGAKNEMDVLSDEAQYTLPLTDVFRFNEKIAGPGNRVLSLFGIKSGRMFGRGDAKGEVVEPGSMTNAGMILCRTNAQVIKETLRELDNPSTPGNPRVVGTTARAYDELESFIDSWAYLIGGGSSGTRRRPRNMHPDLQEYDNLQELQDSVNTGTASQKAKTLLNLGFNNSLDDLERVLGNIQIWSPGEDDEATTFDLPDSFDAGDIGTFGDAEYEVTENEIIFSGDTFPIKDYIKKSGANWRDGAWKISASTPEERENAFSNLLDVLENGASVDDYDFGNVSPGSNGNFGDIKDKGKPTTFAVSGSGVTLNNLPFIKKGDNRDEQLRALGFVPKQVNGVWGRVLPTRGMSEEEIKESLQSAYRVIKGELKPYSQMFEESEIDEIIQAAENKIAQGKVPEDKLNGLQYALDKYKRVGYLRRREWDNIEKQAKMKRPKKEIDVKVLTAHLAKGLEEDDVQLADDFWGPTRNPKTGKYEWPDQEHMNVIYVALTRAKKRLDMGSAAWILDYTSEDDELPNAPGEREGLSSGRAKRTVGEVAKRKPFTEEERQAFRDGVRTRAQTIPGKRRGSAPGDMDGARGNANNRARRRGLSSGSEPTGERELTNAERRRLDEETTQFISQGSADLPTGGRGGFNPYGGSDYGEEEPRTRGRGPAAPVRVAKSNERGWGTVANGKFTPRTGIKNRMGRFDLSLGSMAFNDGRQPGDPWMLSTDRLRKIFTDSNGEQLPDNVIASILGLKEADIKKWDEPGSGIPEIVVNELLELRDGALELGGGAYGRGSANSQIRKLWGFRAAPAWVDNMSGMRLTQEEFDFTRDNSEKEFFKGFIVPDLEDDFTQDLPLGVSDSGSVTGEEIAQRTASAQEKKTLTEANNRENFTLGLLGRYLGIIGENGTVEKGDYPKFVEALKALGWPLEESVYKSWLDSGIPSDKVDQLVDFIRDAGYPEASVSGIFGADLAVIDELPLKFLAKERAEKILVEQGLPENEIKNIFSYAFSGISDDGKPKRLPTSYSEFLSYKESKKKAKAAGEVYSPPGKAAQRFTNEELDRATTYINKRLAENGKPELTKEQIFQIKKVDTQGMKARGASAVNTEILEGLGVSTEKPEAQSGRIREVTEFMPGGPQKMNLADIARMSSAELSESINEHEKWVADNDLGAQNVDPRKNVYNRQIERLTARRDLINEVMSDPDGYRNPARFTAIGESDDEYDARLARLRAQADEVEAIEAGKRSSGLSSGAGPSRKTPSAKEVSDFVSLSTQRGKASGALSDSDLTPPIYMVNDEAKNAHFTDIGQRQFSKLKNALRAREVLADMFSEIADNPNMTVDDLGNTDIDKPQQAIDSIKRLDGYIDSIVDQMNKIEIQARREQEEMKKMEKSQKRVFEMLDSLTSGREDPTDAELELEQDLEMTLRGLDGGMKDSQSALDNQYGPLLEMRKRMLEAVSSSQGFSRNRKKIRTKGANALSIKQLVNVQ